MDLRELPKSKYINKWNWIESFTVCGCGIEGHVVFGLCVCVCVRERS